MTNHYDDISNVRPTSENHYVDVSNIGDRSLISATSSNYDAISPPSNIFVVVVVVSTL